MMCKRVQSLFLLLGLILSNQVWAQGVADLSFPKEYLYWGEHHEESRFDYRNTGLFDFLELMPKHGSLMADSIYFERRRSSTPDTYYKMLIDSAYLRYDGIVIYREQSLPISSSFTPDTFKVHYNQNGDIVESYLLNGQPLSNESDTLYRTIYNYNSGGELTSTLIDDGTSHVDSSFRVERQYYYSSGYLDSTKLWDLDSNRVLDEISIYRTNGLPDSARMYRYPTIEDTLQRAEFYKWNASGTLVKDSIFHEKYFGAAISQLIIDPVTGIRRGHLRVYKHLNFPSSTTLVHSTAYNSDSLHNVESIIMQKTDWRDNAEVDQSGQFHFYYTRVSGLGISSEVAPGIEKRFSRVFPNPVRDHLIIESYSGRSIKHVALCALSGRVLADFVFDDSLNKRVVNLNDVPPGVYLILIQDVDGQTEIEKIIKS